MRKGERETSPAVKEELCGKASLGFDFASYGGEESEVLAGRLLLLAKDEKVGSGAGLSLSSSISSIFGGS